MNYVHGRRSCGTVIFNTERTELLFNRRQVSFQGIPQGLKGFDCRLMDFRFYHLRRFAGALAKATRIICESENFPRILERIFLPLENHRLILGRQQNVPSY